MYESTQKHLADSVYERCLNGGDYWCTEDIAVYANTDLGYAIKKKWM